MPRCHMRMPRRRPGVRGWCSWRVPVRWISRGTRFAVGDFAGQAIACVENMRIALGAAGAVVADVIFLRVLVASNSQLDLGAVWKVVREAFGSHDVPGTLMGVTVLRWADQLVEV